MSEWVGLNVPINILQVILETSLSSQSLNWYWQLLVEHGWLYLFTFLPYIIDIYTMLHLLIANCALLISVTVWFILPCCSGLCTVLWFIGFYPVFLLICVGSIHCDLSVILLWFICFCKRITFQSFSCQCFWILLELRVMEVVVTTGAIRRAKLQSNHHHQQTNIQFFYRPDALPVTKPTVSEHLRENL